jgi:hypothetical protein
MKKLIALSILLLMIAPVFASNSCDKECNQVECPMEIQLTDVWIQDHFKAMIVGNQIQVLTSEIAYEDADVTLVNALTGFEYNFFKVENDSRLNISELPKGTYILKISEDLLYECMTKIKIG